jgi:hypothetical protein
MILVFIIFFVCHMGDADCENIYIFIGSSSYNITDWENSNLASDKESLSYSVWLDIFLYLCIRYKIMSVFYQGPFYTEVSLLSGTVFYQGRSSTEVGLLSGTVFYQGRSSTEGGLLSGTVFYRGRSSAEDCLIPRSVFHPS